MPQLSSVFHARARVAAHAQQHGPDDPHLPSLRRDLRAARLEDYVQKVVQAAPKLTDEQIDRIHQLLPPPSPERIKQYLAASQAGGGDSA
jgi:hypothetical protein